MPKVRNKYSRHLEPKFGSRSEWLEEFFNHHNTWISSQAPRIKIFAQWMTYMYFNTSQVILIQPALFLHEAFETNFSRSLLQRLWLVASFPVPEYFQGQRTHNTLKELFHNGPWIFLVLKKFFYMKLKTLISNKWSILGNNIK